MIVVFRRRRVLWRCATVLLGLATPSGYGQETARWTNPLGGDWHTGANWSTSPAYPNNNPPLEYDAVIDLPGSSYSVRLEADATISNFALDADAASLFHTAGVFRVNGIADIASGAFRLEGGTVSGGVWNLAPGTFVITSHEANRLHGVTINGDLLLDSTMAKLRVSNGLTVNGNIVMSRGQTFLTFDGIQELNATNLLFDGDTNGTKTLEVGLDGQLTIGQGTVVAGGRGRIFGSGEITNRGVIRADVVNRPLDIQPDFFVNHGRIEAGRRTTVTIGAPGQAWSNAATGVIAADRTDILWLQGAWNNEGVISISAATLNLDGSFATADVLGIQRDGGEINIIGRLNNVGQTLEFNSTTGSWNLAGGTITGGNMRFADGARLDFLNADENALSGVSVDSDLYVIGGRVQLVDGTTVNGAIHLEAGVLRIDAPELLSDSPLMADATSNGLILMRNDTSVFAPTVDIRGGDLSISNLNAGTIINRGLIRADQPSLGAVEIAPFYFVNEGRIEAVNGGSLAVVPRRNWTNAETGEISATDGALLLDGNWSNLGSINATDSAVTLDGSFTTADLTGFHREGGSVLLRGMLDNQSAQLVFDGATGSWTASAATILGGEVLFRDGQHIQFEPGTNPNNHNFLDSVSIVGDLNLTGPSGVIVRNGLDIQGDIRIGNGSYLSFESDTTLDRTTVVFSGTDGSANLAIDGHTTLTLGPDAVVRGGWGSIGRSARIGGDDTLRNLGLISADQAGKEIEFLRGRLFNGGVVEATNMGEFRIQYASAGDVEWTNEVGGIMRASSGGVFRTRSSSQETELVGVNRGLISVTNGALALGGVWDNYGDIVLQNAEFSLDVYHYSHQRWQNTGTIAADDSDLSFYKPDADLGLNVGLLNFDDSTVLFDMPWRNDGALELHGTSVMTVRGLHQLGNYQIPTLTGGDWRLYDEARLDFVGAVILVNDARILLSGNDVIFGALEPLRENLGSFTLEADADWSAPRSFVNEGDLKLDDASVFEVRGDFDLGAESVLSIELSGLTRGESFSWIDVLNRADLDGVLRVTLDPGFSPEVNDTFAFLTADSVLGSFSGSDLPNLPGDLRFTIDYDPGVVSLRVIPEPGTVLLLSVAAAACARRTRRRQPE